MHKIILLGLTTTPKSDWRKKVEEIDSLRLREIALFPTAIKIKERKKLYKLLEKTKLKKIPHVHLRDDMKEWELDYLAEKYNTKLFNIHPNKEAYKIFRHKKYNKKIFIENLMEIDDIFVDNLNKCGGICLDVSHWHDQGVIQNNYGYNKFFDLLKKYKIGCCHISAIQEKFKTCIDYRTNKKINFYSYHYLNKLRELDYVKKYIKYLPDIISIELENSFKDQLKVKDYLEKIINKS